MPSEATDWLGLAGRVCVVTGAGSGIGAGAARSLAAAGCHVALLDRNVDAAAAVAAEIAGSGGRAIGVAADVSQPAAVAAAAQRIEHELGACQVLVNNAAIQPVPETLLKLKLSAWNQLLAVNLTGALVCAQAFGAQMVAAGRGGCIINIASIGGDHAWAGSGAYCVSKAGIMMLTRMLALELAEHRIRCNSVKPGLVHTPATEALYADPEVVRKRERIVPVGRVGKPSDLANVITFLASDRADYINGEDIMVDGGVSRILMSLIPRPAAPRTEKPR
jgi:NAD(P)-dependent dehydrogenase (short-subunit alcohol dehydrogenase family)